MLIPLPSLALALTLLTSASTSLTVSYTTLSSSSSITYPFADLTLFPPTLTSYTPPPVSSSSALVRLSIGHTSTSTLTTISALHAPGVFRVHLSPVDNSTIGVDYQSGVAAGEGAREGAKDGWPGVEVMYASQGPRPVLNRPVVLNEEGKVEAVEPEKSLLQRYWWVLLGVAVLALASGGDK